MKNGVFSLIIGILSWRFHRLTWICGHFVASLKKKKKKRRTFTPVTLLSFGCNLCMFCKSLFKVIYVGVLGMFVDLTKTSLLLVDFVAFKH